MYTTWKEKTKKKRDIALFQAGNRLGIETPRLTGETTVKHQAEILLSRERLDQRKVL